MSAGSASIAAFRKSNWHTMPGSIAHTWAVLNDKRRTRRLICSTDWRKRLVFSYRNSSFSRRKERRRPRHYPGVANRFDRFARRSDCLQVPFGKGWMQVSNFFSLFLCYREPGRRPGERRTSRTLAMTASAKRSPVPSCPSISTSNARPEPHAMADFEVHIDLGGRTRRIGLARSNRARGSETILFEYDGTWLDDSDRSSWNSPLP